MPIVDRAARDHAALALRRFLAGKTTNDQFCDAWPASRDPALDAIYWAVWPYYDDMHEHSLTGADRLLPSLHREMLRWVLFLDSPFPYVWPPYRFNGDPRVAAQKRLSLFGGRRQARAFLAAGDFSQWPFASRRQWKEVLSRPKRLNGQAEQQRKGG